MGEKVMEQKDFTGKPLCLSGCGVTRVFGMGEKKTVAVDHVDFDFHEGEFVSIVGESGSGKTTLSKMLLGLMNATEGAILFQGKTRDISSGRKNIGRGFRLFSRTRSLLLIHFTKLIPCCLTASTCAAAGIFRRKRRLL